MRLLRALAFVLLAASSGCYRWGLFQSESIISRQGEVPRCDAIVVPGCPALPDGRPSTCIQRRVTAAVEAWREGFAPVVILSGGAAHNPAVEADVMAAYARALGLPDAAIVRETSARHTTENIAFSSRIVRARGGRRVLLVTDAFQLPFVVDLARERGLEPYARLAHLPLPRRLVRHVLPLDRWEPIPTISWR